MQPPRAEKLIGLINELRALPAEIEWVEFKRNKAVAEDIGEYISALSNSAALADKVHGYLVWGVDDATHDLVGTDYQPRQAKVGNEEIENWLLQRLSPKVPFQFLELETDGRRVVVLEVGRAYRHPVQFQNAEFVRIGSYKKKLKDFPEKERALWRIFDHKPFESLVAAENLGDAEVLALLDYPAYFDLAETPLPENRAQILDRLARELLITRSQSGGWDILNLGAILFAKKLDDFVHLN
jgi:ATP-dependent DNA helicase RecG